MLDQAQMLKDYINRKKREIDFDQPQPQHKRDTRILAVTSGKGGVGKSNFTVNFAIELAKRGKKVLIIDADFGLSNIDVILGITPKYDLSYVIRQEKSLGEVICTGPFGVRFISGGSGVYDLLSLGSEEIEYVLGELEKLDNSVDIVIFDTGAGINENNVQLLCASNEVILVTTPEPPAIVDAYALAKILKRNAASTKIRLVINRAESKEEAQNIADNFMNVARNYLKADIEQLGYIAEDPGVVKAVKTQKPFVLSFPNGKAAESVAGIADTFTKIVPKNSGGFRRFLQRMIKR